jgi:hypothetical protein
VIVAIIVLIGGYYAYTRIYLPWHYKPLVKTWVADYGQSNLNNLDYDLSQYLIYTEEDNWSGISNACNALATDTNTWINDPSFPVPIIAVNLSLALDDYKNAADACRQAYSDNSSQWSEIELKLSSDDLSEGNTQMQTVNQLDKQYDRYF